MSDLIIIAVAAVVIIGIASLGGRGRRHGPGIRRKPNSHYTSNGTPKRGYDTKHEAQERARALHDKDGAKMDVYRCSECPQWHVGHER